MNEKLRELEQVEMDLKMCLSTISGYHLDNHATQLLLTSSMGYVNKLIESINTPKHETVEEWETINHELAYPKDNELCLYESELGAKFLGYLNNGIWYLNSNNNPIDKHFNIVRFMRCPESNHSKPEIEG